MYIGVFLSSVIHFSKLWNLRKGVMAASKSVASRPGVWVAWAFHLQLASDVGAVFCVTSSWVMSELHWIAGYPAGIGESESWDGEMTWIWCQKWGQKTPPCFLPVTVRRTGEEISPAWCKHSQVLQSSFVPNYPLMGVQTHLWGKTLPRYHLPGTNWRGKNCLNRKNKEANFGSAS